MTHPSRNAPPRLSLSLRRLGSWGVDLTLFYFTLKLGGLIGAFVALLVVNSPQVSDAELQEVAVTGWNLGLVYWFVGFALIHYVLVQGFFGATLGKWIFGLRLVRSSANDPSQVGLLRAMIRVAALPLSLFPFGYGVLHGLLDSEGQAWHDLLAGTTVVRASSGIVPPLSARKATPAQMDQAA